MANLVVGKKSARIVRAADLPLASFPETENDVSENTVEATAPKRVIRKATPVAKTAKTAKPAAKFSATVEFSLFKETPGSFHYKEIDSDGEFLPMSSAVIGSLYVRKSALGKNHPERLTVTVEASD